MRLRAGGSRGAGGARDRVHTCLDLSARERATAALSPVALPGGPAGFTIDWPTVRLVWSDGGYPADPPTSSNHRLSENGTRLWSIGGRPTTRRRRESARRARGVLPGGVRRPARAPQLGGRPAGPPACSRSTRSCSGAGGPRATWLREVIRGAELEGVRLLTLPQALAEHEPEERPAGESSWGEGKSLETWGFARGRGSRLASRRLELRLLRRSPTVIDGGGAKRAPRASCSRFRPRTGPSWTTAGRPATTHTTAP